MNAWASFRMLWRNVYISKIKWWFYSPLPRCSSNIFSIIRWSAITPFPGIRKTTLILYDNQSFISYGMQKLFKADFKYYIKYQKETKWFSIFEQYVGINWILLVNYHKISAKKLSFFMTLLYDKKIQRDQINHWDHSNVTNTFILRQPTHTICRCNISRNRLWTSINAKWE